MWKLAKKAQREACTNGVYVRRAIKRFNATFKGQGRTYLETQAPDNAVIRFSDGKVVSYMRIGNTEIRKH